MTLGSHSLLTRASVVFLADTGKKEIAAVLVWQVLLGESVSFECGVEAEDVTGVDAWWLKDGVNLTRLETNRKYDIQVPGTGK